MPTTVGTSLYVRPTIIANEAFLGVRPAKSYLYFVILSPVGAYYPEGMKPGEDPRRGEVRARGGGRRSAAPRRAPTTRRASMPAEEAKHEGYTQVLWLDGVHRKYIDEVGTMNIMVRIGDEVITPPLSRHDPGRRHARLGADPAARVGAPVSERPISIDEVVAARTSGARSRRCGARAPPPSSRRWASSPTRASAS